MLIPNTTINTKHNQPNEPKARHRSRPYVGRSIELEVENRLLIEVQHVRDAIALRCGLPVQVEAVRHLTVRETRAETCARKQIGLRLESESLDSKAGAREAFFPLSKSGSSLSLSHSTPKLHQESQAKEVC